VIRLEEWVDIVSLQRQGLSIRAIARRLGVSRNTVRLALRRHGPPRRIPQQRPPSKLEPFKDYLLARLAEFPELSAEVLFEEISAMGYPGGRSILKDFTMPYRVRRREPVVRFETPPGQQAQVDWAHLGVHAIDGVPTQLYLFAMVLGFSRALYAEVTTSMRMEPFLAAHVRAFNTFGGVPAELLYDNAKTVVLSRGRAGPVFHPALLDFAGTCGFSPKVCRPYRAKTKGKVERTIGYVRDRFFVGRTFIDLDDVQTQLSAWVETVANTRDHKTTGERPCDRMLRENLAAVPPVCARHLCRPPAPSPSRPSFRFAPVEVESRPLSVYEEVCV
jgi:transposase